MLTVTYSILHGNSEYLCYVHGSTGHECPNKSTTQALYCRTTQPLEHSVAQLAITLHHNINYTHHMHTQPFWTFLSLGWFNVEIVWLITSHCMHAHVCVELACRFMQAQNYHEDLFFNLALRVFLPALHVMQYKSLWIRQHPTIRQGWIAHPSSPGIAEEQILIFFGAAAGLLPARVADRPVVSDRRRRSLYYIKSDKMHPYII